MLNDDKIIHAKKENEMEGKTITLNLTIDLLEHKQYKGEFTLSAGGRERRYEFTVQNALKLNMSFVVRKINVREPFATLHNDSGREVMAQYYDHHRAGQILFSIFVMALDQCDRKMVDIREHYPIDYIERNEPGITIHQTQLFGIGFTVDSLTSEVIEMLTS